MRHHRSVIAAGLAAAGLVLAAPGAMAASGSNAFNPDIGFIMQGRYASFSEPAGSHTLPGFLPGPDAGVGAQGFSLGESELSLSSNVDDQFYGFATASIHDDHGQTSIELELAYLQTLALPDGFTVRAGQFYSDFGYQNSRHSHTWDFVDQPLVYEAMLNGQYKDPGVQVTWLAPTDTYILLGAEAFSGDSFPAANAAHSGNGANNLFMKVSGDLNDSNAWQAGLSYMSLRSTDRVSDLASGGTAHFTGDTNIAGFDLIWKWSPNGNFHERNLIFQTEYLHRSETGTLGVDYAAGGGFLGPYSGSQNGWYAQAAYQFMPRWRVGLRYDRLSSDNSAPGLNQSQILAAGFVPKRLSGMVDFSNSEFSRIRLQYNHDASGPVSANQVFLQYIVSLGAHGAHQF